MAVAVHIRLGGLAVDHGGQIGIMQNEWAGAQAFSSFDTYLAPFVKVDHLTYPQVKQCVESFIFGVNTPSRWGTQAPFSNITLDWTVPDDLAGQPAIVGGKELNFTYGDCKAEMDMMLPKQPNEVCRRIREATGVTCMLVDANDFERNILGKSPDLALTDEQCAELIADNPAGNSTQLTPFVLIRKAAADAQA